MGGVHLLIPGVNFLTLTLNKISKVSDIITIIQDSESTRRDLSKYILFVVEGQVEPTHLVPYPTVRSRHRELYTFEIQ
jgi:hypothetical protein